MDESDTGTPSADPILAEIKRREQNVKDAIRRGEPIVDTFSFGADQLRLRPVVADEWGRLWRVDGTRIVLVFSPVWFRIRDQERRQPQTWRGEPTTLEDMDALMGADVRRYEGK